MTSRIDQLIQIPQGDTRQLPFTVSTPAGGPQSLDEVTIDWRLGSERDPVLTLDDDGVIIRSRSNPDGEFVIELSASATDALTPRVYKEVVTITDNQGNVTQFIGQVKITPIEL
jgi:hypothetical protein